MIKNRDQKQLGKEQVYCVILQLNLQTEIRVGNQTDRTINLDRLTSVKRTELVSTAGTFR